MKSKNDISSYEQVKEILSFYSKRKVKTKLSEAPKIDMNPVCDLAFQLIIFFMLATTFMKPQAMEIVMPDQKKEGEKAMELKESKVLNIVLGEKNVLFWYLGNDVEKAEQTNYSTNGIRKLLMEKNNEISDLMVLIKPSKFSTYKNLVDILDEISITEIKRHAIVEVSEEDKKRLLKYK